MGMVVYFGLTYWTIMFDIMGTLKKEYSDFWWLSYLCLEGLWKMPGGCLVGVFFQLLLISILIDYNQFIKPLQFII